MFKRLKNWWYLHFPTPGMKIRRELPDCPKCGAKCEARLGDVWCGYGECPTHGYVLWRGSPGWNEWRTFPPYIPPPPPPPKNSAQSLDFDR